MNKTPRPGRGWRILRRSLISLAVLATLVALFYTEEDWRGKHAWEAYKHKWEAKGEKFDWQAFVPPTVPSDQNFFATPIFTNMLDGKIVLSPYYGNGQEPEIHWDARRSGYAIYRVQMTDLQAWQHYYRHPTNTETKGFFPVAAQSQTPATDVLLALSKYNSAVEKLRHASERPYANMPLPYKKGVSAAVSKLLPYLVNLKRCTQVLQLRADAELADGQAAQALDDVKLMLSLDNSLRNSPFLISALVRIATTSITFQPIWEGLAEHKWSDEQLARLDAELGKMDFLANYEFAMRCERAFAIATLENQRRTREIISATASGYVTNRLYSIMPSAYFYQNELAYAQMVQQWLLPLVDTNSRVVSRETKRRSEAAARTARKHYSFYKVQSLMSFSVLETGVGKFAYAQAGVDLARVACALERYRLAHGEYPKTLDALAPQFIARLPHDIMDGQPLHYHRTANGEFLLYSVGWNGTDDGGRAALRKSGSVDPDKGDWVWQYPAK